MSHFPPGTVAVVFPTTLLIIFNVLLFLCFIGLAIELVVMYRRGRRAQTEESIYTSNSDLSQEDTKRVRAIR